MLRLLARAPVLPRPVPSQSVCSYSIMLRTFSYAPRKMNPPTLMKAILGTLPAKSLKRKHD